MKSSGNYNAIVLSIVLILVATLNLFISGWIFLVYTVAIYLTSFFVMKNRDKYYILPSHMYLILLL